MLEATTVIVNVADACSAGLSESVTCTVKVFVETAVAVPEITPVDESSDNPDGSIPLAMDQLNGAMPPVVRICWL